MIPIRLKKIIYAACAATLGACSSPGLPDAADTGRQPEIYPDYAGVTLPPNLAPVRFRPTDRKVDDMRALFANGEKSVVVGQTDGMIAISPSQWAEIATAGDSVNVTLYTLKDGHWSRHLPFALHVANEEVDPYIAYRKIEPGYETWNEMGIYQRCLENYDESAILTNRHTDYGCMNCHSFCAGSPDTMLLHLRVNHAGTYVAKNGEVERLNTATPETISALVYPSWHPGGRYVAFSTNTTTQMFHTSDPNRIEVMDHASDVVVYDTESKEILLTPLLASEASFETFPTFSPDGHTLYFCTADSMPIPEAYDSVRYNICSIPFDPGTRNFGESVDTIVDAAAMAKSASFPRVSPDGRHLMFTLSDYGNFSIWHREADLYMADLHTGRIWPLDALNSDETESYHSWSSNGRWVVFASRRLDGLYTRPFIAYIDAEGRASKPVLVPQYDIDHYNIEMKSYNVPEFVKGKVETPPNGLSKATRTEAVRVKAIH